MDSGHLDDDLPPELVPLDEWLAGPGPRPMAVAVLDIGGEHYLELAEVATFGTRHSTSGLDEVHAGFERGDVLVGVSAVGDNLLLRWGQAPDSDALGSEANAGLSFLGVLLTVMALLAGFGLDSFPTSVIVLLVLGIMACLASLVCYANATGVLARLGAHQFEDYFRVGNVLSEFGGILLVVLVLPTALTAKLGNPYPLLLAGAGGCALAWMMSSMRFDIESRYLGRRAAAAMGAVRTALCLGGVVLQYWYPGWVQWWALAVAAVLVGEGTWCLRRRESG